MMDTYFGKRCKQDPNGCTTCDAMMLLVIGRVRREWLGMDEELEPESLSVEELILNEVVPHPLYFFAFGLELEARNSASVLGPHFPVIPTFVW